MRIERASDVEKVLRVVQDGRTVLALRDYDLSVRFAEFTGRPPKELWITAFSGGAHCCFRDYVLTQEGGERGPLSALPAGPLGRIAEEPMPPW